MYNLGDHFKRDQEGILPNPKCVYKGEKYRITVLSEILVRLEYSEDGIFEDRPTELVWNRLFNEPKFAAKEDTTTLEIKTSFFTLVYLKEKPFIASNMNPSANLKIILNNTDRIWHFNHPEARNFYSPAPLLSHKNNKQKSLYSLDGFVSIDDSKSQIFTESGELIPREKERIDTYVLLYYNDFTVCSFSFVSSFVMFFFKQMTSYDIFECDWSSAVCYSVLLFQISWPC